MEMTRDDRLYAIAARLRTLILNDGRAWRSNPGFEEDLRKLSADLDQAVAENRSADGKLIHITLTARGAIRAKAEIAGDSDLWERRVAAARAQAQGEERALAVKTAQAFKGGDVRCETCGCWELVDAITDAIQHGDFGPGGAPPICAGGIEPTDTWRPTRPDGAPDEGASHG